jgi:hypothetical protein
MSESNNNYTEAPEFDHLGCATTLLRSIGTDVNKDPRLLTPKVTAQIQLAEEALAAALREIHAAKGTLRVEDEANSEKDKIISKANFNTYFGDLNGMNFANMDKFNEAIKDRYVKLYKDTGYNKIGISGFKNGFQTDGRKFDQLALAELQINIDDTQHKLFLLPFRHYLEHPQFKHTILLYVNEPYQYGPVELRQW